MTGEDLYREAYNLHERAEAAAMQAMQATLCAGSVDALACLCDSSWGWETRSFMSEAIIDEANEVLNVKLDRMVSTWPV